MVLYAVMRPHWCWVCAEDMGSVCAAESDWGCMGNKWGRILS